MTESKARKLAEKIVDDEKFGYHLHRELEGIGQDDSRTPAIKRLTELLKEADDED